MIYVLWLECFAQLCSSTFFQTCNHRLPGAINVQAFTMKPLPKITNPHAIILSLAPWPLTLFFAWYWTSMLSSDFYWCPFFLFHFPGTTQNLYPHLHSSKYIHTYLHTFDLLRLLFSSSKRNTIHQSLTPGINTSSSHGYSSLSSKQHKFSWHEIWHSDLCAPSRSRLSSLHVIVIPSAIFSRSCYSLVLPLTELVDPLSLLFICCLMRMDCCCLC